jgi:hypothetical protein
LATISTTIPLFQSARALYGLTSGVEPLDSFIGPLKEGWVTCFSGSKLCYDLLTRYAVNAQLLYRRQQHPNVIFIDGGNSFDAYGVARYAKMQRMDPTRAWDNILVSRAFTLYQLATLIIDEIPKAVEEHGARVVLVSDITALFSLEEDGIDEREAKIVFSKVKRCLNSITKKNRTISICSSVRSKKFLDDAMRAPTYYSSSSSSSFLDVLVKIEELHNGFRAKIIEYPREVKNYHGERKLGFGDSCNFNLASKMEEEKVKKLTIPVIKYATPS